MWVAEKTRTGKGGLVVNSDVYCRGGGVVVEVCRRCRVVVEVVGVGQASVRLMVMAKMMSRMIIPLMRLLWSLIDGNTYPLPSFVSLRPGLRVSTPLIAIEASLLFCFDFRLRSVFVIVLIHHRNAKGEQRHAAGRAGKEHSNWKATGSRA